MNYSIDDDELTHRIETLIDIDPANLAFRSLFIARYMFVLYTTLEWENEDDAKLAQSALDTALDVLPELKFLFPGEK